MPLRHGVRNDDPCFVQVLILDRSCDVGGQVGTLDLRAVGDNDRFVLGVLARLEPRLRYFFAELQLRPIAARRQRHIFAPAEFREADT
jgi:hypothetical protein